MNTIIPNTSHKKELIVQKIRESQTFKDYKKSFSNITGMPLNIRPPDSFTLQHSNDVKQNQFCVLMSKSNHSCSACLELQRRLKSQSTTEPKNLKCFAGLIESTVPIFANNKVVAYLETGQVMLKKPNLNSFSKIREIIKKWNIEINQTDLQTAYYNTRVINRKQLLSIIKLLEVFAHHLSYKANQLSIESSNSESPLKNEILNFIDENLSEDISIKIAAEKINVSYYYYCKIFKKETGLTFINYITQKRVEKAKSILLTSTSKNITEIAYEVGFQSVCQFGRSFRKITGTNPTTYRLKTVNN